jgi:hypothetical protein
MKIEVWHAEHLGQDGNWPLDYAHVADVEVDSHWTFDRALEIAFAATNHIDRPWWENENVSLLRKSRSTSVGDVEVIDGIRFRVEPCGFAAQPAGAVFGAR